MPVRVDNTGHIYIESDGVVRLNLTMGSSLIHIITMKMHVGTGAVARAAFRQHRDLIRCTWYGRCVNRESTHPFSTALHLLPIYPKMPVC